MLNQYILQTHFGISSFSHPDNALEVCGLLTPLHIVPEWYFLCQYAMLKAVPNKNAGFIILLTSIFTLFFFGEIRNLTTFTRLMDYNNGFSLSFFFNLFLSFLWIGAQFPQEKFLSYGRILTLDYYFLLMCILFHFDQTLSFLSFGRLSEVGKEILSSHAFSIMDYKISLLWISLFFKHSGRYQQSFLLLFQFVGSSGNLDLFLSCSTDLWSQ